MKDKAKIAVFSLLMFSGLLSLPCVNGFTEMIYVADQFDAKGDRDSQINYHIRQIKKYKSEVEREEQNERRSVSNRQFSEARNAQKRKAMAMEKIYHHTEEVKKLRRGASE